MELSRRNFLGLLAATSITFLSENIFSKIKGNDNMIIPEKLRENDLVGVISPATAVPNPDELIRAKEILEKLNLRYTFARSISKGSNYKSRSVAERVDDLVYMFRNPDIRAVFCIRGGYGSGQLLDEIDYSTISSNPKIFVGYSDTTALHIAFNKFAKMVTFHGPMLLSPFTQYSFENLKKVIFGLETKPKIQNPSESEKIRSSHFLRTIYPGSSEGKVIGGNLSIICSLLGTDFEYDFQNSILFLEDVQEDPYRIDRMLNQLRLAKKLNQVNGIIFGECIDCLTTNQNVWDFSLGEVLDYYFKPLKKPSAYGLCLGHTPDQATIPIGAKAYFDAEKGILQYLENVVM
ncbi:MAG: LD-carboxypeptidase [Ignavibacteria bacterium]|nr:LD-carboxypeptidase [Ignavibacteria bacterium]